MHCFLKADRACTAAAAFACSARGAAGFGLFRCGVLAAAEKHHADLWVGLIQELGGVFPVYSGSPSGQADALANRLGGADLALRRVEIDEGRDIANYGKQMKAIGDQPSLTILREVTPMNAITIKSWTI